MPKADISFTVPKDFKALLDALDEFPGASGEIDFDALDRLDEQLQGLVGEMVQVDFDEQFDPAEPIDRIIEALKPTEAVWLASHESHTDPARGDRYQARILARVAGSVVEKQFPWPEGEPDVSDRSHFVKAGFSEEQIRWIDEVFFPAARALKP